MATPPFTIATTSPADSDVESAFPAVERTYRDVVSSWLNLISDSATGQIRGVSTDAGAATEPAVEAFRDSASPQASDFIGNFTFTGRSSTGVKRTYSRILSQINDPTNASEDASLLFQNMVAGTLNTALTIAGTAATFAGTLASGAHTVTGLLSSTAGLSTTTGTFSSTMNITGVTTVNTLHAGVTDTAAFSCSTLSASSTGSFGASLDALRLYASSLGSAATPTFSWQADTNSGIYHTATGDLWVMSAGGAIICQVNANGLHVENLDYSMADAAVGMSLYTSDPVINIGRTSNAALQVKRRSTDGRVVNTYKNETNVGGISVSAAATTFDTSSDKRRKENWHKFDGGRILDDLEVWKFKWKDAEAGYGFGVLAQDADEVFPQAITYNAEEDLWSADYSKYVPLLIEAVQTLRTRVAQLEKGD